MSGPGEGAGRPGDGTTAHPPDQAGGPAVVRRDQEVTIVPAWFFQSLLDELDAPDEPNERLRAAARRARDVLG